jgi:hypothetical protein
MLSKYNLVSGLVFGVVALLQFLRAINQWPVLIDNFNVPVWASWLVGLFAAALCAWAFQTYRGRPETKP